MRKLTIKDHFMILVISWLITIIIVIGIIVFYETKPPPTDTEKYEQILAEWGEIKGHFELGYVTHNIIGLRYKGVLVDVWTDYPYPRKENIDTTYRKRITLRSK